MFFTDEFMVLRKFTQPSFASHIVAKNILSQIQENEFTT